MERFVSDIIMLLEQLIFFCVVFRMEYRKIEKSRIIGLVGCALVWISTCIVGYDWQGVSIGPLPMFSIWIYIVIWMLFDITVIEMIVMGIGQWLLISMLENALYIILQPLQFERNTLENVIMLLISCTFLIFYFWSKKKYDAQMFRLPIKMWCFLDVIMLVLTAMISFFTYVLINELPDNRTMFMGQALSILGEVVVIVLIFAILYYCNSTYDFRRQKELAEMQNRQQREYFLQLLEREEETKSFRHDIINDLLEMHNYCMNRNCKQMEQYLENTLGIIQKISKSSYDVGNDIVNTVINYYLRPLKETCSIEIDGYMSEKASIEDRELCILSANLIKNASEAVRKIDDGKIWVKIEEGKRYLYIQVKNTFEGEIKFNKKGMPITSKQDKTNHGIGTRSIVDIVKKNGGTYSIDATDGIYKVEVYLKIRPFGGV